jgi:hypothetical protein
MVIVDEKDLTSAEIWKPIFKEITKILEQKEVMRANLMSMHK